MTSRFCKAPFAHLYSHPGGEDRICCAWTTKETTSDTPEKRWNNNLRKRVRQQFISGQEPEECVRCWNQESTNKKSVRMSINQRLSHIDIDYSIDKGNQFNSPLDIDFRASNLCNLSCRMCRPDNSSQLDKELEKNPKLSRWWEPFNQINNLSDQSIDFMFDNVQGAVSFLGGEPTIMPEVKYALQKLIDQNKTNITIRTHTNGTNLNFSKGEFLDLLEKFSDVYLNVSIDGTDKTVEYIRHPVKFENLKLAIEKYNNIFNLGLSYCLQAYNIHNLYKFLEFAKPYKAFIQKLEKPYMLDYRVLPIEYRKKHFSKALDFFYRSSLDNDQRKQLEHYYYDSNVNPGIHRLGEMTKNLDESRNQHIRDYLPELWEVLEPFYK